MRKRFISVCIIGILVCSIFGCAQTVEDSFVADTEATVDAAEHGKQTADSPVLQEEPEPAEEIEYDYFDTYLPILAEYERAWEDGIYTIEELIIGIRGEDGIAPCFLYTGNGERVHMTDSRIWSDLVEKPTILYENGIVESTEYIKYGMCRYNFYQLSFVYTSPREVGRKELIDRYFYIEDSENGTRYYKGDIANPVTEEEFWNGIGDYESMPQIKLDWHELEGFWEPDEEIAETIVIGEEHRQSEKEGSGDGAESAVVEAAASNDEEPKDETETKKDEPVTVVTKMTEYYSDGSIDKWYGYEYDSAGNIVKDISILPSGWVGNWYAYEYDSEGNLTKKIEYEPDGRYECEYITIIPQ